jgi:hypothetical protein
LTWYQSRVHNSTQLCYFLNLSLASDFSASQSRSVDELCEVSTNCQVQRSAGAEWSTPTNGANHQSTGELGGIDQVYHTKSFPYQNSSASRTKTEYTFSSRSTMCKTPVAETRRASRITSTTQTHVSNINWIISRGGFASWADFTCKAPLWETFLNEAYTTPQ